MTSPRAAVHPATHGRRRGRPRTERHGVDELARELYVSLACVTLSACTMVLAVWALDFTVVQVAACLCAFALITGLAGSMRIRAVAAALRACREGELRQVVEAARAAETNVIWTATELCRGGRPPLPEDPGSQSGDALGRALEQILNLKVQAAHCLLRVHNESQAAVLVTMHQTLSRRQHSLIGEMLEHLTLLQNATEDAELLDRSFKIDHLATRLRRLVESVSVVLGDTSLRETRHPVPVAAVLRGAKSEVVKYTRVVTAAGDVGSAFALPAHVHPDVTHLLAELIDNAVDHSDPAAKVIVRAQQVAHGLLFEVEDRAVLLMDPATRDRLNELLRDPGHTDVSDQVRHGSLGLITAAKIAARYRLQVWLSLNPTGGTTANVVVPSQHLVPTAPAIATVALPATPPTSTSALSARPPVHGSGSRQADPPQPGTAVLPQDQTPSGDASPLPRRRREQRPMPSDLREPALPARTADPQVGADWRTGLQAGLQPGHSPTTPS
ncbi:ATP-binding protein [Streptomyces sp. NPDC088387]|uniref:sensor histidine kinase n=1 Tax=Streptomyces sp. NPDC088387 TaxID=3365859 RepID=UPI00382D1629